MTREEKINLVKEIKQNMPSMTKEQYVEMCKLCDELELEIPQPDPEDLSWDEIIDQIDN